MSSDFGQDFSENSLDSLSALVHHFSPDLSDGLPPQTRRLEPQVLAILVEKVVSGVPAAKMVAFEGRDHSVPMKPHFSHSVRAHGYTLDGLEAGLLPHAPFSLNKFKNLNRPMKLQQNLHVIALRSIYFVQMVT